MKTFAQLYCSQHGVADSDFERTVLHRCLRPAARCVALAMRLARHDYFSADLALVRNVGRLAHARDFSLEASHFWHDPANTGWPRRRLGWRISTHRLLRLMQATAARAAIARDSSPPVE